MSISMPNPFSLKVIRLIQKIPKGKVATYGQIAQLACKPRASRAVAWILHSSTKKYRLPWHRVISSRGKISFRPHDPQFLIQRKLLMKEKVLVVGWNGEVDLKKFQMKKNKSRTDR